MAGKKVTENPYEDGDDAKFVKAHRRHKIAHGTGSSGRTAKFTGHKKRRAKKIFGK